MVLGVTGRSRLTRSRPGARLLTLIATILIVGSGVLDSRVAAAQFRFDDYPEARPPSPLRDAIAGWEAAMRGGDGAQIAAQYAPQGWLKLPCAPAAFGRTAIAGRWRDALASSPASLSLHPSGFELSRSGDMAIERGWAQLTQNVGGLPYATNVDYLRVWSRTSGRWQVSADVFAPGGPCEADGQ